MKVLRTCFLSMVGVALLVPQPSFAIGKILTDNEMFESDGVTCGYVDGSWTPGSLKGAKFISHVEKKKQFAKKAKKSSGSKKAKFSKKKKKFAKLYKQQNSICADGNPGEGEPSASRGIQYFQTSCALSGCHGSDNPAKFAGYTSSEIQDAYQSVTEMKLLQPPGDSDMADLVAYFESL